MAMTLTNKALRRKDKIVMFTTMSWLLSSGLSSSSAVHELLEDPNNKLKKSGLIVLKDDLEEGKALSEAFRDNEDIFGTGLWRQIDAAERTGKLPECLQRIADQIQNDGDLMSRIRGAVTYPAVILLLAVVAGYYMFTTIVPQMADMLLEFDVELPPLTKAVMAISYFMIDNALLFLGGIVGFVLFIRYLLKKPLKYNWNKLLTKMPYVGPISVNMNYSIVYTLLSDMIENGAHLIEALRVASGSSTNIFIKGELLNAAESMERDGYSLSEALIKMDSMPSDDKLMLQIGSRSGRELELLGTLSTRRKSEAYASVNAMMEVMPTFVLLVVAAVVGVMVVSIYMPMISMATDIA